MGWGVFCAILAAVAPNCELARSNVAEYQHQSSARCGIARIPGSDRLGARGAVSTVRRVGPAELWEAICRFPEFAVLLQTSDALARPVAVSPHPMIRPIPTLHGTALAVSALVIATTTLAFDAGRTACPCQPAQSAHLTQAAR